MSFFLGYDSLATAPLYHSPPQSALTLKDPSCL